MYNYTDVNNIIAPIETKLQVVAADVCDCVQRGNLRINMRDFRDYQSIKYLFSRESFVNNVLHVDVVKLLVDHAQDIGRRCNIEITVTSTSDCHANNILAEDGDCLITESGNNIITQ